MRDGWTYGVEIVKWQYIPIALRFTTSCRLRPIYETRQNHMYAEKMEEQYRKDFNADKKRCDIW